MSCVMIASYVFQGNTRLASNKAASKKAASKNQQIYDAIAMILWCMQVQLEINYTSWHVIWHTFQNFMSWTSSIDDDIKQRQTLWCQYYCTLPIGIVQRIVVVAHNLIYDIICTKMSVFKQSWQIYITSSYQSVAETPKISTYLKNVSSV